MPALVKLFAVCLVRPPSATVHPFWHHWRAASGVATSAAAAALARDRALSIGSPSARLPGRFVLVDHALSRAERGLAGYLIVDGDPNPEIFDVPPNDNASGH